MLIRDEVRPTEGSRTNGPDTLLPSSVNTDRALVLTATVATGVVAIQSYNVNLIPLLAFTPLWISAAYRSHRQRLVWHLLTACLVFGSVVTLWNYSDPNQSMALATSNLLYLARGIALFAFVCWALGAAGIRRVCAAYGLGATIDAVLAYPELSDNFWKYGLAWPITLFVLSVLGDRRRDIVFVALLALSAISVLNGSRFHFALCLLAAAWMILGSGFFNAVRGASRRMRAVVLGAVAIIGYQIAAHALASGLLGEQNRMTVLEQTSGGATLIVGGRPEWFATYALMRDSPLGHGPGAVPTLRDISVAQTGLQRIGISGQGDYYLVYMFGGHFKLHSVLADLWVSYSIIGIALGLVMAYFLVATLLEQGHNSSVVCFVTLSGLWFLAFGPILSNLNHVLLAVAVCCFLTPGRIRHPRRT